MNIENNYDELKRNEQLIDTLSSEFTSVYYVDLVTGEMQITKLSGQVRRMLGAEFFQGMQFSDALNIWISAAIRNSDSEELKAFASAEYIRSLLRDRRTYSRVYRVGTEESFRYNEMKLVKVNPEGEAAAIVLGIADRDDEIREAQRQEIERQRNTEIIEILASEYSSVYYIDLTTDELNPYTMNAETESEFGQIFNSGITYSEAFKLYVEKLIYDEDKAMMLNAGSIENIREELEGQKTFITRYRSSDNRYNEMKFVKVGGDDDEPVAVALGFADKDDEIRDQMERGLQQQRYNAVIKALSSEYASVYFADIDSDTLMPYSNSDRIKGKFGADAFGAMSFSAAVDMYVSNACMDRYKDALRYALSPENIRRQLNRKTYFTLVYQNDQELYNEMKCVRADDSEKIRNVVIGFAEKNDEIRERLQFDQERQMNFDIIEILASEYTSVYYIDLTTDSLNPYTMNEETETTFGSVFRSGITYSEAYRLYVDKLVFPEDKPMMLKAGSIGNIMKELRTQKTFLTTYRNADGHYSEMKFVKVGNEEGIPTAVALGFADKDAELRAKEEEARVLQRNIDIIEILASEYSSVYYIDMTTDELDPYTMNEQTETQFGKIFRSGIKYSDAFKMYVRTLVYEEDVEMMLKAGSVYNILKELGTKKTFLTTYRDADGKYCEMKFVKVGDDENPQAVALGFANKDDEIRANMEREAIAARDAAVISGLSDDFGCVVYVNYETDEEIHYRFDPLFEKSIPGWSSFNNFTKRLSTLMNTIMHPDDRESFWAATRKDVVQTAVSRDNVYYVNFRTLIDGEVTYYQTKFVRDENTDTHVIAGFHNVDAETKREMEALERAETASRAKTDFLFNMSHDIRTPMNAIIGFTNMAKKNVGNPEKLIDNLNKTQQASNLLLSLINSILDMSRIESGKAKLEEVAGDVRYSFENIKTTMQELASTRNVDLSFEIGDVEDNYVYVDLDRCVRVFINIITNAIKYTGEGGRVKVRVDQTGRRDDGYGIYLYTFEDNGIGMSEEFQKHVFDQFSREENSTTSGIQGTGLGLSVVKSFVELMNGKVECRSRQGEGTTFYVTLPFRLQDREDLAQYIDPETGMPAGINLATDEITTFDFSGKRILLVEDNELNREIAVEILEDEDMLVETAADGSISLQKLREKGPDYYDFILMDIQMPVMGGYEATKAIRNMYPDAKIPIIALSANAFEEDKSASLAAMMDDHVAKPINITELFSVLAKYL